MTSRFATLLLFAGLVLAQQMRMTVEQVTEFIRSSVKLRHPDKQVSDFLKNVKMTERLDARAVEELQGLGAGPKTVAALNTLSEGSASLPAPQPPAAKPVYVPPPPPDSIEQKRLLAQVTEYAIGYSARMPDFICLQLTQRFVDPSGMEFWHKADTIQERLSYFEGREDYKVVLYNNRPVSADITHEKLGGATSSGEFVSVMKEIFDPSTKTDFEWERWATLRGRRTHVFSYRVPNATSKYTIQSQGHERIIVGYHGLIYVDRDQSVISKITLEADEIPPAYPIRDVKLTLDYATVQIADRDFFLPYKSEIRSRQDAKYLIKNEVEFRNYRKFTADATITAVDVEPATPLPAEATKEQPVATPTPDPKKK